MPSMSKAKRSASKVFAIIEEKSQIDPRAVGKLENPEIKQGEVIL
jgi:hypothetical protein